MAVPNISNFWKALKASWINRLFTAPEETTWKQVALSKLAVAMKLSHLTSNKLLLEGTQAILRGTKSLSNPFWKATLSLLPVLEARFYERNKKLVGERTWWDTDNFKVGANALAKKNVPPSIARCFPCIRDFINPNTGALYTVQCS